MTDRPGIFEAQKEKVQVFWMAGRGSREEPLAAVTGPAVAGRYQSLARVAEASPILTVQVLKAGFDVGGYLLAITGLGGLIAAVTISSFGFIFKKGKVALGSVIFSSITVILFAWSPWVPVAFIVIAVMAFFQAAFRTTNGTLIQTLVPDELRSRITSLQGIGRGLVVFSSLAVGWFVSFTSVVFAITTIGIAGITISASFYIAFKKIKILE